MSLAATTSHVIIDGNNISPGYYTPDGTIVTAATYQRLCVTNANAKITNNTFNGQASSASHSLLNLDSCSAIVSDNQFVRGSSTIASYINVTGTNDSTIVDNVFDSPTVDGTSENLVTNLTANSIYERNVNQTSYAISYLKYHHYKTLNTELRFSDTAVALVNDNPVASLLGDFGASGATTSTLVEILSSTYKGTGAGSFNPYFVFLIKMNDFLPTNVKILNCAIGLAGSGSFEVPSTSTFTMSVKRSLSKAITPVNLATMAGTMLDPTVSTRGISADAFSTDSFTIATAGDVTAFATTKFLTLDTSSYDYVTGKDRDFICRLTYDIRQVTINGVTTITVTNGQFFVKYRWV